ncbi:MAG: hypothetical protein OSB41_13230 [Kiritimatiellae bacterium]|nr:hypothetical protein [Kiritimatiellia bacterium]
MNSADLLRAFASPSLTQANRAFRLHWGSAQSSLERVLIAHRIDISEGLCSGIVGHVTCLSTRADLPLNAFIGLPASVQMVTDRGALHPICAIVTDARDSITPWSASRQLAPGNVQRASWDYKSATVAQASETSSVDQGETGNDLAQVLRDAVIDVPHAGDSWSDYERVSTAMQQWVSSFLFMTPAPAIFV